MFKHRPCWHSVAGGEQGSEISVTIMATPAHDWGVGNKRDLEHSSDEEDRPSKFSNSDWYKFIVLQSLDDKKPLNKVSPFLLDKTIKGCAGDVKNVTKMRNGCILIECYRQQQSKNLMKLYEVGGIHISSLPHGKLNFSHGIIRDRDGDLSDLPVNEICKELLSQGVIDVILPKKLMIKLSN